MSRFKQSSGKKLYLLKVIPMVLLLAVVATPPFMALFFVLGGSVEQFQDIYEAVMVGMVVLACLGGFCYTGATDKSRH